MPRDEASSTRTRRSGRASPSWERTTGSTSPETRASSLAWRRSATRLGPFDLTLIEAGAYGQAWPDWHLGPEQAVQAHALVQGRALLPIHWGTFKLAAHGWTEPVERVLAAARPAGIPVFVPRPGESLEPGLQPVLARWWPELPWHTAREVPILATLDGLKPLPQP